MPTLLDLADSTMQVACLLATSLSLLAKFYPISSAKYIILQLMQKIRPWGIHTMLELVANFQEEVR